jgi:radical SAM family uncharacterized protein
VTGLNYDSLLWKVAKPCRYLNAEWNSLHKNPAEAKADFCLCYPDVYEVGMSHLGLRILYHILNDHPDYLAERAFAPWPDMEQALREAGTPLLSLESERPLGEFAVVGFTLAYELTYTNLLTMLDLGGIPLKAAARAESDPIVIAGGPGAANPEPLADYLDAVVLGEAEESILEIAAAVAQYPPSQGRQQLLERLAQIPGVYVPAFYQVAYDDRGRLAQISPNNPAAPEKIRRRLIEDLDTAPYPVKQIVPYLETVHDRVVLEIMRGCTRACRFCQAGMTYRPVRQRSIPVLLEQAKATVAATGLEEISLLGFNSPDFCGVEELIEGLLAEHADQGVSIALPSSRTDTFSVELAKKLARVRRPGLTFAPEAGSQRLREVINKQVTEENLFSALAAAFASGWEAAKLYFMIGLPTETLEDVGAITELLEKVVSRARESLGPRRGRLRFSVSIGNFVPKAHTPFQWWGQETREDLRAKQALLIKSVRAREIKLSWNQVEMSRLEAAFSRGDRRLGEALYQAWQGGARFDSWAESLRPELWEKAFAAAGLDWGFYANRSFEHTDKLPWEHLDYGVSKEFLLREAAAALAGELTPDCREGVCSDCGACEPAMRNQR